MYCKIIDANIQTQSFSLLFQQRTKESLNFTNTQLPTMTHRQQIHRIRAATTQLHVAEGLLGTLSISSSASQLELSPHI
jgi:hypothetical protein